MAITLEKEIDMFDLTKLQESKLTIDVQPSNNIFEELGRNTYDYKDLLSELIDNSIASRHADQLLNVNIDLYVDANNYPLQFNIRDDAKGIPQEILALAITPAGLQSKDSLNEHGMGMKQAVAGLGKLRFLATKTKEEAKARLIREFRFGNLPLYEVDFDTPSGTWISIEGLNPIVSTNSTNYTRSIVPYLGARYRRFLKPDHKLLNLIIRIRHADQPDKIDYEWPVEEEKPIYFHPSTRANEPVIYKYPLEGEGWAAELTFGYSPNLKQEYEELGLDEPNKFHPYRVSLSTQGLDVLSQNRIILFHQLSELGIIASRHNDYNTIRGEIDLKHGFSTAITKNSIIVDRNFEECIDKIRHILNGQEPGPGGKPKEYLKVKTYPEELPEKLLRDRLMDYLVNNPLTKRKVVNKEYVIEGIEGYIDIFADGEAWELKVNQSNAYDVYQLFMYMDVGKINKGYLVAKDYTTGAKVAVEHINKTHGKEIVLASRDKFPINHPPTDAERTEYY
jgi:hypothetical protein